MPTFFTLHHFVVRPAVGDLMLVTFFQLSVRVGDSNVLKSGNFVQTVPNYPLPGTLQCVAQCPASTPLVTCVSLFTTVVGLRIRSQCIAERSMSALVELRRNHYSSFT